MSGSWWKTNYGNNERQHRFQGYHHETEKMEEGRRASTWEKETNPLGYRIELNEEDDEADKERDLYNHPFRDKDSSIHQKDSSFLTKILHIVIIILCFVLVTRVKVAAMHQRSMTILKAMHLQQKRF